MRIFYDRSSLIKLTSKIETKINRLKNIKPLMPKIATLLYKSVMKNFQEQGTDKEKWSPLKEATIKRRRKGSGFGTPKILQDTGFLKRSIFPVAKENEAIVYTNVPYAPVHQFGTNRAGRNNNVKIPARPFMVLRQEYKDLILKTIEKFFGKYGD